MTNLLLAIAATLLVGGISALLTLRIAQVSVRWGSFLAPLSVVLAMGAGLLVGVKLMLIEGAEIPLLLLAATAPVALLIGALTSAGISRVIAAQNAELEVERRRREVEIARRELISGLSHDLRTPLAGVRAMAEALQDGVAPDPARYHHMIVSETERTTEMVNDLLALANLQAGANNLSLQPVSVDDLVSDLLAQLRPLALSREVSLVGEPGGAPAEVLADARLLTRAFQNVIVNGLHYTKPGTEVSVRVKPETDVVRVLVRDGCGGLSQAELDHCFEAGWRGDVARSPHANAGSGIGLPTVRTILESHGGTATIRNDGPGCLVELILPKSPA